MASMPVTHAVVEAERERQRGPHHRRAGPGDHGVVEPAGADDGHLRRDHDQSCVQAPVHAEVGQGDGGAGEFLGRDGPGGHVGAEPIQPGAQVGVVASPTSRNTGTKRPASVSTATPTSTRSCIRRPCSGPRNAAVSAGSVVAATPMALRSRTVTSDSGVAHPPTSARSVTVAGTTSR